MRRWKARAFATALAHTTLGDRLLVVDTDERLDCADVIRESRDRHPWAYVVGTLLGVLLLGGLVLVGMAIK